VIVVDTNVVSEIVKVPANAAVLAWFAAQKPSELYVTTVTQGEVLYGIELLPQGRRRTSLHGAFANIFDDRFAGRILPFDEAAAHAFSLIAARHKSRGRNVGPMDSQIAAIALSHGAPLATRNVRDFVDCGVELINPWG
jgi:predicted nucleic acid-binding protein